MYNKNIFFLDKVNDAKDSFKGISVLLRGLKSLEETEGLPANFKKAISLLENVCLKAANEIEEEEQKIKEFANT